MSPQHEKHPVTDIQVIIETRTIYECWAVYDHPLDYPDKFIARFWINDGSDTLQPTKSIIVADTLAEVRDKILRQNHKLKCLVRPPGTEAHVIETWL